MKRIMHLDIDAFFASAELLRNPQWSKKPIVVCNNTKNGIVSTANYLARAKGIRSAMKLSNALKLVNDLVVIKADLEYYKKISQQFFNLLFTELRTEVEIVSVDECYLDVTELLKEYNNNELLLVSNLKYKIKKQIGLHVTIGIAKNKYLAKLISDNAKPNGFLSDLNLDVKTLQIDNLLYINDKKINLLKQKQILTVNDFLAKENISIIKGILNNVYDRILVAINAENEVIKHNINKPNTISRSHHFFAVENNNDLIFSILRQLLKELETEIQSLKLNYKTISIYFKNSQNQHQRLSKKIDYTKSLFTNLQNLFDTKWKEYATNLVGISFSEIVETDNHLVQEKLF